MRWEGHVALVGIGVVNLGVSWGDFEKKRSLGRPRRRCEDNIKVDLLKSGVGGMGWITVAQDTDRWRVLVNAVIQLQVPQNEGNFLTS